jgi:hypothetical protein
MYIHTKLDNNTTIDLPIFFDKYGNLYVDIESVDGNDLIDDLKNQQISSYQININNKNVPCSEPGVYKTIDIIKNSVGKFQLVQDHNMLQKKATKKLENVHDMFDENNEYEELDDSKYYPEQQEYFDIEITNSNDLIDEDNINMYGHHNQPFKFSDLSSADPTTIKNIDGEDISALYDTYVYDNNILKFYSNSKTNDSLYVLRIDTNGSITLRLNGSYETNYELLLTKFGKLLFVYK